MTDINWQAAIDSYIVAKQNEQSFNNKYNYPPNVFRASSLSGCVRECVRLRQGLIKFQPDNLRFMQVGVIYHRFIQQEVSLGHINQRCEFEKYVELRAGEIAITGHIDCYDGETIYDFKTTADIDKTTSYPIKKAYELQLSLYSHALGKKRMIIVYVEKSSLRVIQKEVKLVPLEYIIDFCKKVAKGEENYLNAGILPDKDDCYPCKIEESP